MLMFLFLFQVRLFRGDQLYPGVHAGEPAADAAAGHVRAPLYPAAQSL